MAPNIRILDIQPGSDGDSSKWPDHSYDRNDEYFLQRLATDKWIRDLPGGAQPGVTYQLNRLPTGYAGFEKTRSDGVHKDRYLYGHPNGQFRSLNEIYPHFKYLMDNGGAIGCPCKLCQVGGSSRKSSQKRPSGAFATGNTNDSDASQRSRHFTQPDQQSSIPQDQLISPYSGLKKKATESGSEVARPLKRKLVDHEQTPDVYETMIKKLKAAGPDALLDEPIEERMSPDWRTGDSMCKALLDEWRQLPQYVPRTGELVLFVPKLAEGVSLVWDGTIQTFRRRADLASKTWLERPYWEAGIVTQMSKEPISEQDLITSQGKEQSVTNSGFRVEALLAPGNEARSFAIQGHYVPLHAMRPLCMYQACLKGIQDADWTPSVKHALSVMSSLSLIGRYRFKGTWPNATVFARGAYIGSDLITVGDTVRLLPKKREQALNAVTDIMVVTAIRLRFVNMDLEDDEEASPALAGLLYQTCLYISGRVYTLDPIRSFDGVGKVPIDPDSGILPTGLGGYGPWYHYTDPRQKSARVELPFTRVLGRCYEDAAFKAWFSTGKDMPPSVTFQAVNKQAINVKEGDAEISRGLDAIAEARKYSMQSDKRIKSQEGKTWFWGDTRIEQLDLHEVNGRFVGVRDQLRTTKDLDQWRAALKAADGKKGGLEEYHAARFAKAKEENAVAAASPYGMVASSMHTAREVSSGMGVSSGMEQSPAEEDDGDAMEIDEATGGNASSGAMDEDSEALQATTNRLEPITLHDTDSEDEDGLAQNQLVGALAKNIRPNDARVR